MNKIHIAEWYYNCEFAEVLFDERQGSFYSVF